MANLLPPLRGALRAASTSLRPERLTSGSLHAPPETETTPLKKATTPTARGPSSDYCGREGPVAVTGCGSSGSPPSFGAPQGAFEACVACPILPNPAFPFSGSRPGSSPHSGAWDRVSVLGATLRHVPSADFSAPLRGCLQQPADVCRAWAFISELMSGEACWGARTPPPIWQPFPTRVVSEGTVLTRISILYPVIMRRPSPSCGIIRGQLEPLFQKT